jgi:hypothetical protein
MQSARLLRDLLDDREEAISSWTMLPGAEGSMAKPFASEAISTLLSGLRA